MARALSGTGELNYLGVQPKTPPNLIVINREPTTNDVNYNIGDIWVASPTDDDVVPQAIFMLVSLAPTALTTPYMSADWALLFPNGGGGETGLTIETNDGNATPNGSDEIFFANGTNIAVSADDANTVTFDLNADLSIEELQITTLGAGTVRSDVDGNISVLADGTNGQVMIGSTGGTPAWSNLTEGNGILINNTSHDIEIALDDPVSIANGGTFNDGGDYTDFGVAYYDGTKITTTDDGTAGYVLTSNGPGVAPTYQSSGGGGGGGVQQISFLYYQPSNYPNATGHYNSPATYQMGTSALTQIYDTGSNVTNTGGSATATFTAPVAGKYYLKMSFVLNNFATQSQRNFFYSVQSNIVVANNGTHSIYNQTYGSFFNRPNQAGNGSVFMFYQSSVSQPNGTVFTADIIAPMDANATATFNIIGRLNQTPTFADSLGIGPVTGITGFYTYISGNWLNP